ncbi:hypothetical protein SAMN03159444_00138 [Pseudomonas sp. NFACC02]|uniref:hypothetical protein n=1 Tax=Pseudomonas sp. NFACC02 TaxID=1566250 RepID=UPI0008D69132|nr:hypothetical protein [Pseudomonas sp. NFACC02]SEP58679.1 hypothetical protein SAMN03159444_00138 [Pseudomonas sp. NFACC02]
MTAKTPKQRQQDKRDRDKMSKEDREARLLSRRIVTDLYHNDDAALKRIMARTYIDEPQDIITRLIRGADRMPDDQLNDHIRIA